MCELAKDAGNDSGDVLIESSVAGIQMLKDRDGRLPRGPQDVPGPERRRPSRYNNNDLNTAASQVNDALTANPNLVGIFADNNTSGNGAARAIKDNNAADRIPVVAFDTDPQENAALADGSIDALVVQNPYFFGYQGVVEAAMAAVGSAAAARARPGRRRRGQGEHGLARGQAAAEPADREGAVMSATVAPAAPTDPSPVVSLRGVSKRYGPIQALEDVDLELRAGEVHCLAGENGAGKSTLIKILTGADPARRGRATRSTAATSATRSPAAGARRRHRRRLPGAQPAARPVGRREPADGPPAGAPRRSPARASCASRRAAMLERVGLDWLDPDTPGRGRSRWPSASSSRSPRCSAQNPRVLIFDEPTTALSESRDQGAARAHPRAARRGPRRHVRVPPPRGDVRDRRPRDDPARRRLVDAPRRWPSSTTTA